MMTKFKILFILLKRKQVDLIKYWAFISILYITKQLLAELCKI